MSARLAPNVWPRSTTPAVPSNNPSSDRLDWGGRDGWGAVRKEKGGGEVTSGEYTAFVTFIAFLWAGGARRASLSLPPPPSPDARNNPSSAVAALAPATGGYNPSSVKCVGKRKVIQYTEIVFNKSIKQRLNLSRS